MTVPARRRGTPAPEHWLAAPRGICKGYEFVGGVMQQ